MEPATCGHPMNCSSEASSRGAKEPPSIGRHRRWCISGTAAAGKYSVYGNWLNSAAQRHEMLTYGEGGGMGAPVLKWAPRPLPCR